VHSELYRKRRSRFFVRFLATGYDAGHREVPSHSAWDKIRNAEDLIPFTTRENLHIVLHGIAMLPCTGTSATDSTRILRPGHGSRLFIQEDIDRLFRDLQAAKPEDQVSAKSRYREASAAREPVRFDPPRILQPNFIVYVP